MLERVQNIINEMRAELGQPPLEQITANMSLRDDLQFDSLALAEFTVKIEFMSGVDIFADGLVETVGDVLAKLAGPS
jgi:acyl carrier protein